MYIENIYVPLPPPPLSSLSVPYTFDVAYRPFARLQHLLKTLRINERALICSFMAAAASWFQRDLAIS